MPAYRPQAGDEGADMAISAKELPLGKVFTPDFRFTIPSFQRAYIWKTENILQLVSDLDDACKSPGTPYFLGSLILVREGDNRYDVIDGQQRLVSLSIIIAVLRDLERDPDLMRQLDALLVEPGDKLRGIVTEPRLTLRERDAAFFREHVQEDNLESVFDMNDDDLATAAQRNIVANIRKTYDEISNWSASERQQFAQYLVNEVTLVIVTTDDLDGAHRIFDVMNMRGLPLTPSDVFKARATASLSTAELDVYAARWDDIIDPLGDDPHDCEEFFAYLHLVLTHKPATDKLIEDFLADVLQKARCPRSSTRCWHPTRWRGGLSRAPAIPYCPPRCVAGLRDWTITAATSGSPWPCGRWSIRIAGWATPICRRSWFVPRVSPEPRPRWNRWAPMTSVGCWKF